MSMYIHNQRRCHIYLIFKEKNIIAHMSQQCATCMTMHTCVMRVACISPQAPKQGSVYESQDPAADKSVNNISADGASAGGFESIKSAIDRHFSEHPSGLRNVVSAIILVNPRSSTADIPWLYTSVMLHLVG